MVIDLTKDFVAIDVDSRFVTWKRDDDASEHDDYRAWYFIIPSEIGIWCVQNIGYCPALYHHVSGSFSYRFINNDDVALFVINYGNPKI